jgi:16S rRNA G1207 methylase RsmC
MINEDWKVPENAKRQERRAGVAELTPEQREAVADAIAAMGKVADCIAECHDVWMSDVHMMATARSRLNVQFNALEEVE